MKVIIPHAFFYLKQSAYRGKCNKVFFMVLRKILYCLVAVLFAIDSYSQIDHIKVLVGLKEADVVYYMDSLLNLKTNEYYKIKRDINADGDLMLKSSFSMSDEPFYTCYTIMCIFVRQGGVEYCVRQIILGAPENAVKNINFIKSRSTKKHS